MKDLIDLYKQESAITFANISSYSIEKFVDMILSSYENDNKVFVCGNGGNAAYVANFVTDLNLHPFVSEDKTKPVISKKRIFAINLVDSCSTITGILNDFGADFIFSEQLRYSAKPGDLFIGISGSGNSKNVIQAMQLSKSIGMKTIVITKNSKSDSAQYADIIIEITGVSTFPGQTGKNNNNFHFEDCVSKLSHIATGILKLKVSNESQP